MCRFLAIRGAKHVALVSWRSTAFEQQRNLGHALGIRQHIIPVESLNRSLSGDSSPGPLRTFPPVKGVVQAHMVLQVRAEQYRCTT